MHKGVFLVVERALQEGVLIVASAWTVHEGIRQYDVGATPLRRLDCDWIILIELKTTLIVSLDSSP